MVKKTPKHKAKKNKRGSHKLPQHSLNPDALFTMVLSCQTFIADNLKRSGIKVNKNILLNKVAAAVLETMYPTKPEEVIYNVAADALAAAYLTFQKGEKVHARKLVNLAFQSPDAEILLSSLVAINEKAVGTKLVADDMSDDAPDTTVDETDSTNTPDENAEDTTEADGDDSSIVDDSQENDASDEAGGGDDSDDQPSMVSSSIIKKRFKRALKKHVKAASDDYQINYGIDGPQGDFNSEDFGVDIDDAQDLLEVESLGGGFNDFVPDTMRLGRPTDINEVTQDYPDNLAHIDLLTATEIETLRKKHPEIVTVANKIAILGDAKGLNLAHRFMRKALSKAA